MKLFGVLLVVIFTTVAVMFVFSFVQAGIELNQFEADCRQLSENRLTGETSWHCNDDITYFKDRNGQITNRVGMRGSHPKY